MRCHYLGVCSGCHFVDVPYEKQLILKSQRLTEIFWSSGFQFSTIQIESIGQNHLRTRLDMTLDNGCFGFYDLNKKILDIDHCLQLSHGLQQTLQKFRAIKIPIKKGSVRLRISPTGQSGVWLDFANLDIKNLLEEKKILISLLEADFFVEMGQKGKFLSYENSVLKLAEPKPQPWFQCGFGENNYVTLNCLVSSFTQPSWVSAQRISWVIENWMSELRSGSLKWAEFGAGIGQFTLPLLNANHFVDVFEFSAQASELLLQNAKIQGLGNNLKMHIGDFQKNKIPNSKHYDVALLNPPRSGLKNFVFEFLKMNTQFGIYISCFPDSLAADLKILTENGFQIEKVVLLDQFPQTQHFETCVLLKRIDFNTR